MFFIADQNPEVVTTMKQAIDRWFDETGALKEPGANKEKVQGQQEVND